VEHAPGIVYLLHFDRPYRHARHYLGQWAQDLDARLADHDAGRGARLTAVVKAAGIGWTLVGLARRQDTRAADQSKAAPAGAAPNAACGRNREDP
jgi:hypothetical protein